MMDFKIINDILTSKYMVHIVVALTITCCVMYYIFEKESYLFAGILSAVFLLLILITYIYNKCVISQSELRDKKNALAKDRATLEKLADEALTYFKGLSTDNLNHAINLYNHKNEKEKYYNERYIGMGEEPGWRSIGCLTHFHAEYPTNNYRFRYRYYIGCDNEHDCYNGGCHHIVIDQMFYAILKNYIATGQMDYPANINLLEFKKAYPEYMNYPNEH